jgi:PTH1 family peptidyl-tRNA hydrolase
MPVRVNESGAASDLVVVGLGNPGPEYARTRHNIGWLCLEAFGRRIGIEISRRRWRSRVGSGEAAGRKVWLLEPQTFMNLSGRAVHEAMRDLGVGPESLWVVHDEMDLPLCRLRIRTDGSDAGHNGVRSIIAALGTNDFVRFRVGVGKQPAPGHSVGVRHVLGRFTKGEGEDVEAVVENVASALETALHSGVTRAMELYNRAGSLGCEELR